MLKKGPERSRGWLCQKHQVEAAGCHFGNDGIGSGPLECKSRQTIRVPVDGKR